MPHNVSNGLIAAQQAASPAQKEILCWLHSTMAGLDEDEARARLTRLGANVLPRPARTAWFVQLAKNLFHLFAILLWLGALLAWISGMPQLAVAIVFVVLINGVFSYWQQYRARQAVDALEQLLPRQTKVRREGTERIVSATEVALGDIVLLEEGDSVPADLRLLSAVALRVDNSALTGESRPIARHAEPIEGADARAAADLRNIVFAGTLVATGKAEGIAIATGRRTEFGRLAQLTHEQPHQVSTLERELTRITHVISVLAVTMGVLFFVLGATLGHLSWHEGFLFALGIIVANVPEGLLPTLSLALAMAVRRMAARNAIVKRLERVETLGAVTVIVTDKTGTVTENQMTVRDIWQADAQFSVEGQGYSPTGKIERRSGVDDSLPQLLLTAALCCDAQIRVSSPDNTWSVVGDPTEGAILTLARKGGITPEKLRDYPRIGEMPFDSTRKRMTTIQGHGQKILACVKGAMDEVLPRCTTYVGQAGPMAINEMVHERITSATAGMASRGLRVLAIATRSLNYKPIHGEVVDPGIENELTFLGLLGMEDPPRPEVAAAISSCQNAGIRIIMATGDDGRTAAAIGREIGLCNGTSNICSGAQLASLSSAELALLLDDQRVHFSRVSPEHKLRIVEALQKRGEVVAVTGDGVNDAPALKRADIGVAMGRSGTDVARQAADMILTDDNFASIVAAVEEGRAVYDNVRKFVTYIFASNIPEIVPFAAFVLCRIPLPLTVMQILAVDLGTDLCQPWPWEPSVPNLK
jgi:magnesium-transporting ATPase (P-type)